MTAGKLLKLLARKHREEGTKMSELNAVYTKFPQVLINLTADKEQKQAYKEDEYIAGFIESQQQNLMGMGRVLVRVSGTEPKIKVYVLTIGETPAARNENLRKYGEWVKTLQR